MVESNASNEHIENNNIGRELSSIRVSHNPGSVQVDARNRAHRRIRKHLFRTRKSNSITSSLSKTMRYVTLDVETTGLKRGRGVDVSDGHRIIEIACVEIIDNQVTGDYFHTYVNPQMKVDEGATKVHGVKSNFLLDKPLFPDIVTALLGFIGNATIVIHNAAFDTAFLDKEFALLDKNSQPTRSFPIIDTLILSRKIFPGNRNSLDGLSQRFGIPKRSLHGALTDAQILAEIYLHLKNLNNI